MLITCPECDLQVSDKAMVCPHCGFPLKESAARRTYRKSNKRKKLPNGFGRITELHGRNLRKPFRAMVTVGKDEFNRPIGKILDYFETYNDAYIALAEYNKNPYDLSADITCEELHKRWSETYYKNIGDGRIVNLDLAWKYCSGLYVQKVKEIRARHIKSAMTDGIYKGKKPSAAVATNIKTVWNLMLDYAVEYEIVDKNYARSFAIPKDIVKATNTIENEHIIFTKEEMNTLWKNIEIPYVDVILIQCYSGWRPQELGAILMENVDINNWVFKGGMKTSAGSNRIVPIHSKIRPLVKKWYEASKARGENYLFFADSGKHKCGTQLYYHRYYHIYDNIMQTLHLNPNHRPHDPRKQFASMAKESGVDSYAIKLFMGHSLNNDVTEKVYTDVSLEWLTNEIEKIKPVYK